MANDNAIYNQDMWLNENLDQIFDLEELESKLEEELEKELLDLELLKEERDKIVNPDSLGKVIIDEVWLQFGNQIGLDVTEETLIQKYEREHPEDYNEIGKRVMQDEKYKQANKEMKEKQERGKLRDEYTGRIIKKSDKANLDHTVSRKEIDENLRRKQANIATEDLANKKENLNATNESLNKSKGKKSIKEMSDTREEREKELRKQNERFNKKIDATNMSDAEKEAEKEKARKRLQNKLDADDELMKEKDVIARKAINKDIRKGVVKETGKKAGKDALKTMAIAALFSLLKKIMNGFIRFIKGKVKSFASFIEEMKKSVKSFIEEISSILHTGTSTVIGTVVSEIFGPIVNLFRKLSSILKQGFSSLIEAIRFLKDDKNKNAPFSIKVAEVGKIIISGLVATGALFSGEMFEKILLAVPGMQIELPLIGSLASVTGMFFASLISGLIGAIVINLIDKYISKKQKEDLQGDVIEKTNDIISIQHQLQIINEILLDEGKEITKSNIHQRHKDAASIMEEAYENIMEDFVEEFDDHSNVMIVNEEDIILNKKIDMSSNDLDELLKGL